MNVKRFDHSLLTIESKDAFWPEYIYAIGGCGVKKEDFIERLSITDIFEAEAQKLVWEIIPLEIKGLSRDGLIDWGNFKFSCSAGLKEKDEIIIFGTALYHENKHMKVQQIKAFSMNVNDRKLSQKNLAFTVDGTDEEDIYRVKQLTFGEVIMKNRL